MPSNEHIESIRQALMPMRDSISAKWLLYLRSVVTRHDEQMEAAKAEILAHLRANVPTRLPGAWNLPLWLGQGAHPFADTLESAADQACRHVGPYSMASREIYQAEIARNKGRVDRIEKCSVAHLHLRNWWSEAIRLARLARMPEGLEPEAVRMADEDIAKMVAKLAKKIDAMGTLVQHDCAGSDTDCFVLTLAFADHRRFRIFTNRMTNYRLNRPYFQWPSRVYHVNEDGSTGDRTGASSLK